MDENARELQERDLVVKSDSVEGVDLGAELASEELRAQGASLGEVAQAQDSEAEEYARIFLLKAMRLRGVAIDREKFLRAELRREGIADSVISRAISANPAIAGVSQKVLDDIASRAIKFETSKSSMMSFASGVPGGFAVFAAVPADLLQYFVHAFRVMQKIAYVYGWQNLLNDVDEVDDETFGKMVSLLGVMMGVSGATGSVKAFAGVVAQQAVRKQVTNAALTKTAWYGPTKNVLKVVGVKITKETVGKGLSKAIPLIGGVVSGGMTFVVLSTEANRLKKYLRELPPPVVSDIAQTTEKAAPQKSINNTFDFASRNSQKNKYVSRNEG